MTRRASLAAALAAAWLVVPARAGAVCAPAASGIFPASGIAGTSVVATISGSALDGGVLSVLGDPGLTAAAARHFPRPSFSWSVQRRVVLAWTSAMRKLQSW